MTSPIGARPTQRMVPAALMIATCTAGMLQATQASACPFGNFNDFAKAFESQPEVRQAHSHKPLTRQRIAVQGNKPKAEINAIQNPASEIEEVFALQKSNGLTVTANAPDRITLRDSNGETLIILLFQEDNCWQLNRIEDWSLGQKPATADASDPASSAMQRGNLYNHLANETPSDSLIALYASALDSYLYAVRLGSARAAYLAAGISLSGQAPRLDNQRIQSLLETASYSEPDAGLTLANFYCDEGEYGERRPCANPKKSLEALQRSARLGSSAALVGLGSAYAAGAITERNPQRAMACYQEAQIMGAEGLQPPIDDLKASGIEPSSTVHCL